VVDIETVLVSCSLIVHNMFYSGTFLANNCSNTNVEIINNSSNHVGGYASDFPFSARVRGIVVVDPFFEATPEKVVR